MFKIILLLAAFFRPQPEIARDQKQQQYKFIIKEV